MSNQAQLVDLERRHEELEQELHEAMNHPSADPLEITELKRRKLQVKDEISRLRRAETLH